MKHFKLLLFLGLGACTPKEKNEPLFHELLIGSYSNGFYAASLAQETGEIIDSTIIAGIENASFLISNKNGDRLYAVSETENGAVHSFEKDDTGRWIERGHVKVAGDHPCHLTLDKTEQWLFVANYSSGNFSWFSLDAMGHLDTLAGTLKHTGSGPNKDRQESPHVHSVNISGDNASLFVADLGTDQIGHYAFNAATGTVKLNKFISLPPGAGPRHLAFHPTLPLLYVVEELKSSVAVMDTNGLLQQEISTLPENAMEENTCAHILLSKDGKNAYVSNRGHNSLATFNVEENGTLTLVTHYSTLGDTPRNFALSPDERFVLVANQNSNTLVVYVRDLTNGTLNAKNKTYPFQKPVCVNFGSSFSLKREKP